MEVEDGRKVTRAAGLLSKLAEAKPAGPPRRATLGRGWKINISRLATMRNEQYQSSPLPNRLDSPGDGGRCQLPIGTRRSTWRTSSSKAGEDEEALPCSMKSLVSSSTPAPPLDDRTSSQGTVTAIEGPPTAAAVRNPRRCPSSNTPFFTRLFTLVIPIHRHQTGPVPIVDADKRDPSAPD